MTARLLFAEELPIGRTLDLGRYAVSEQEILEFSRQWDPQAFHLDPKASAPGFFGGIVASGLHTLSVFQRLAVLGAYRHWDIVAGRTIREVQFLRPVRPGTVLQGFLTVQLVDNTRPDRALVTKIGQLVDQESVTMTVEVEAYVRRRAAT